MKIFYTDINFWFWLAFGGVFRFFSFLVFKKLFFAKIQQSFLVELVNDNGRGMILSQMLIMLVGLLSCMTALFAHIQFLPPFFVRIAVTYVVNLPLVRFQGASLREGLVTMLAFVWFATCKKPTSCTHWHGLVTETQPAVLCSLTGGNNDPLNSFQCISIQSVSAT